MMKTSTIVTFLNAAILQSVIYDADDNKHPACRPTYDGKELVKKLELLLLLIAADDE